MGLERWSFFIFKIAIASDGGSFHEKQEECNWFRV